MDGHSRSIANRIKFPSSRPAELGRYCLGRDQVQDHLYRAKAFTYRLPIEFLSGLGLEGPSLEGLKFSFKTVVSWLKCYGTERTIAAHEKLIGQHVHLLTLDNWNSYM
jgi:hypothetical protein